MLSLWKYTVVIYCFGPMPSNTKPTDTFVGRLTTAPGKAHSKGRSPRSALNLFPNADVSVCVVRYGSIFARNEDGSISLANDTPFISEETAIANALDFVEDHATERGCTVQPETATSTLKADEDLQYFEVSVDTYEDDGYVVTYDVWVDVHSGEIQSFQFTQ